MPYPTGEDFPFGEMKSNGAGKISLQSVAVKGEIDGLFFGWNIIQEYKNETEGPLEIIYTFPLGWNAALLGMTAKTGEKELAGVVVEKNEAEEKYEEAIEQGNSAILVQKSGDGLHTANLGNIAAGEAVTVRLECARLLNYEQGQVRLSIPAVVGERYGDPFGPGGLAPHESVRPSKLASYPFSVDLRIRGDLARGDIRCLAQNADVVKEGGEAIVRLDHGAVMDRDFVLTMEGTGATSQAFCVEDKDNFMVSASFLPAMPDMRPSAIGLKILVDCSGSMSGSSIAEAKKGLGKVLDLLEERDCLSYSRFGSGCKHSTRKLERCDRNSLAKFSRAIEATDADMGGTELERALKSTFEDIKNPFDDELPAMVLLITDGNVWNTQNIVEAAKRSGHRIFVVGVGFAPGENVLRTMAEQTGGACELVSPQESISETIVRMFHRMRGTMAKNINIDWHEKTLWQSALPRSIYDGETIHAFALVHKRPETAPVLRWEAEGRQMSAQAKAIGQSENHDLCRLGHYWQLGDCKKKEAVALALEYQLVSKYTSLVLVHEREDKIDAPLTVQQVPQMRAHGHGNYFGGGFEAVSFCHFASATSFRSAAPHVLYDTFSDVDDAVMEFDEGGNEKRELDAAALYALWLRQVPGGSVAAFASMAGLDPEFAAIAETVEKIAQQLGVAGEFVWAVLLRAVEEFLAANDKIEPDRHSRRLLKAAMKDVSSTDLVLATEQVEENFEMK